jgi:hypothetical protein
MVFYPEKLFTAEAQRAQRKSKSFEIKKGSHYLEMAISVNPVNPVNPV